jgi:hypothetical protein
LITNPRRNATIMFVIAAIGAAVVASHPVGTVASASPLPSPSPSPTAVPTPYMPLDQVPNGSWDVIEQTYTAVVYSRMMLKEAGDSITGTWIVDKNTTYVLDGSRKGAHLTLQIKSKAAPDATVIGKMEADIDGIADMVGSITAACPRRWTQGRPHRSNRLTERRAPPTLVRSSGSTNRPASLERPRPIRRGPRRGS